MSNETKRTAIQILCDEAKRENTELKREGRLNGRYIGNTREARLIKNIDFQPFFRKHVVSLLDQPVSLDTFTNYDETVRTTAGFYTLTYIPSGSKAYVKGKPYVIGQDMIRLRVTVSGYKHWGALSGRIPELGWIKRWCPQLCPALFGLAKKHPGMNFYFAPDWLGYAQLIEKRAEEQGIDIDHKPFVVYAVGPEKLEEINSTHLMAPKKKKSDYQTVLDEIDLEFKGKEEV